MTKVYLVYSGEYEERDVSSVHSTLESAQAGKHNGHVPVWEEKGYGWTCAWQRVHPASKPRDVTFETRTVPVINGVATIPAEEGRVLGRTIEVSGNATVVSYPVPPKDMPQWSLGWTDYCYVEIIARDLT